MAIPLAASKSESIERVCPGSHAPAAPGASRAVPDFGSPGCWRFAHQLSVRSSAHLESGTSSEFICFLVGVAALARNGPAVGFGRRCNTRVFDFSTKLISISKIAEYSSLVCTRRLCTAQRPS